jgi:CheY-like chemotaxis protein
MTAEGTNVARREQTIVIIGDGIYAAGLEGALRDSGYHALAVGSECSRADLLAELAPDALVVDLMAARRDDFQALRRLRNEPGLAGVPILVSSPGTVTDDTAWLERRLRSLDVRLLLEPHDLEAILGEVKVLARAVA